MARSLKKGPFVDAKLEKKVENRGFIILMLMPVLLFAVVTVINNTFPSLL